MVSATFRLVLLEEISMTNKLDEIREAFEKWAISNNYDIETRHKEKWLMDNPLNPYGDEITNHCFQAWRAALAHFPVDGEKPSEERVAYHEKGFDEMRDIFLLESLRCAGLNVCEPALWMGICRSAMKRLSSPMDGGWRPIETMPKGEVGLCTIDHRADAEMCINSDGYIERQGYKWWFQVPHVPAAPQQKEDL
jgi:hypothetical protein